MSPKLPDGWVLYSLDASIQAADPSHPMTVMLRRDAAGLVAWLALPEDGREHHMLYAEGVGMTVADATENAISKIEVVPATDPVATVKYDPLHRMWDDEIVK